MTEPLDLEPIKARRAAGHGYPAHWPPDEDECRAIMASAGADLEALIAEVERLREAYGIALGELRALKFNREQFRESGNAYWRAVAIVADAEDRSVRGRTLP